MVCSRSPVVRLCNVLRVWAGQVLDRVEPEHLFRPHPKLLHARNRTPPSNPPGAEHWY